MRNRLKPDVVEIGESEIRTAVRAADDWVGESKCLGLAGEKRKQSEFIRSNA